MKFLLVSLLLSAALPTMATVPLADFARNDSYDNATISPGGRYLAMTVPIGRYRGLAVLDLEAGKFVLKLNVGSESSVARYIWANEKRLVVSLAEDFGVSEAPVETGELMGINIDGSNQQFLFDDRARLRKRPSVAIPYIGARPIRSLPNDPGHILIAAYYWTGNADTSFTVAFRLDVDTGHLDGALHAPVHGEVRFVADDDGFVRYAVGDDGAGWSAFARMPNAPEWSRLVASEQGESFFTEPLFLSRDNKRVFLDSDEGGNFDCLVEQNLTTGARRSLACDAQSDLVDTVVSFDGSEPIAARFASGHSEPRLLEIDNPDRKKLSRLIEAFPGQNVRPVSFTRDGSKAVVLVNGDRNPGDYYLFDTRKLKADFLFARSAWLDPDAMPERIPIEYAARDGQKIRGYLTLPPGRETKHLPLVVNPHGGPFNVHDQWDFDPEAAALALRGYAVLQVNFRGSSGFGGEFALAGRRGWATKMIDDITDGTRWAVEKGYADSERIAIYGASYGGYAALMSAIREPDLYRCVTIYAGAYDLPMWKRDTDVSERKSGRRYIDEFIGVDDASLRTASPSAYIDQLKAPVFIVHGKDDERVPYSQAKALREALDRRKHPYEWLAKRGEGHGFYLPENRTEFLTRLVAFLDHCTVPRASPSAAVTP